MLKIVLEQGDRDRLIELEDPGSFALLLKTLRASFPGWKFVESWEREDGN